MLIDCPPSLGLLTINALTSAADGVIVPIQCEYLALEGLGRLWQTVTMVREHLNPQLFISGMVLTMFDSRTNLAEQVVTEVRSHFPEQTFRTVIPRSVRLSEAPSYGQTILTYAPQSAGALAYRALAQELLKRESQLELEARSWKSSSAPVASGQYPASRFQFPARQIMTTPPRGLGRGLGALIPSSGAGAADAAPDSFASGVLEVSVTDIIPNPRQPRTVMDAGTRWPNWRPPFASTA